MDKHVQEYIKFLMDQRTTLELTIVELKRQINELTSKETSEQQGSGESS